MKLFFGVVNAVHILWHIVLIILFKESFYDHLKDHGELVAWAVFVIPIVLWLVWHHYKDIKRVREDVKKKQHKDKI